MRCNVNLWTWLIGWTQKTGLCCLLISIYAYVLFIFVFRLASQATVLIKLEMSWVELDYTDTPFQGLKWSEMWRVRPIYTVVTEVRLWLATGITVECNERNLETRAASEVYVTQCWRDVVVSTKNSINGTIGSGMTAYCGQKFTYQRTPNGAWSGSRDEL